MSLLTDWFSKRPINRPIRYYTKRTQVSRERGGRANSSREILVATNARCLKSRESCSLSCVALAISVQYRRSIQDWSSLYTAAICNMGRYTGITLSVVPSVCVCVCVSVCLSLCPRIFSELGGRKFTIFGAQLPFIVF